MSSVVIVTLLLTDHFYSDMLTMISMEFDILSSKVGKVKALDELKEFVKIHHRLIDASEKFNKIFSTFLFVNIFGKKIYF